MAKKISLRKRGDYYHYCARLKDHATGKTICYSGNTFCTHKRDAEVFAMDRILPILQARTVEECLALRMRVLSGLRNVKISEAWQRFESVADVGASNISAVKWRAFSDWLEGNHPKAKHLHDVTPNMAQEFVSSLEGRSPLTISNYVAACNRVFSALLSDAGMSVSPFSDVRKPKGKPESRNAFTISQINKILTGQDILCRHIFALGMMTGLRLKDVCLLQWSSVDLEAGLIVVETYKTKAIVRIPIMEPLKIILGNTIRSNTYVCAEIAQKYMQAPPNVVRRNAKFLKSCGIETNKKVEGRDRAVMRYGFHSCRHTFAYLAGIAGIPIVIVQSILGHMSPEMTQLYQRHTRDEDAKRALATLGEVFTRKA